MLDAQILEKLKESLFSGRYNLLLGTGISLDSKNRADSDVMDSETLRVTLCSLKKVKSSTTLSRVTQLLSSEETDKHLTQRYIGCRPGKTVNLITAFIWKQIFTFNIDDALEGAYQYSGERKQSAVPINFDQLYETFSNRYELPVVHLHGFVRDSGKGYIFSPTQYANATRTLNPWMHVLSELLGSEAFIIAGTSLNETDLEFYLAGRTPTSPRTDRGPSILIEPYPDSVTENVCERHGLTLVKATLYDFLQWLKQELGSPPTLADLTLPTDQTLFFPAPDRIRLIGFFSSFELVQTVTPAPPEQAALSPFYFGRPPTWQDLASSVDIPLDDEFRIGNRVRTFIDNPNQASTILVVNSEPGSGKTTNIRRIAYDLARDGKAIFSLKSHSSIDVDNAIACLRFMQRPVVLFVDGIADHVNSVRQLFEATELKKPILILGADRSYRRDHLNRVLGDLPIEYIELTEWGDDKNLQLIERFRRNGLLGSEQALKNPKEFATRLRSDAAAVAVCRILNNFQPLDAIVKSIWNHGKEANRRSYLIAALAHFCHPVGLNFSILQAAHENPDLESQLSQAHPLPLCFSPDSDDYVLPLNATVADRVLTLIGREKLDILYEAFSSLGRAVAPYVNRRTIIAQSPEARLAGRLFDADKVVRPLLGERAEKFYVDMKEFWEWTSRYWEQRALLIQDTNLDTAIQYARHAVAIEQHPFPWTTLARILMKKMEVQPLTRDSSFSEAFDLLLKAFAFDVNRSRRLTPHTYIISFLGTLKFLEMGGMLNAKQKKTINEWLPDAKHRFERDGKMLNAIKMLEPKLT